MKTPIQLDKKTVAIGVLTLTAIALFLANLTSPPKAQAADSIKGDQYTAVTGRVASGGEALYLTNRDGLMAVFVYDPTTKRLELRTIRSVLDAFNGSGGGPGVAQPPNRVGRGNR